MSMGCRAWNAGVGAWFLAAVTAPGWVGENNIPGSGYGWSVAGAGDINRDGYADVVIGAPFTAVNGREMQGQAYVYLGSAEGLRRTPAATLQDPQSGWVCFGGAVAGAGDVNGDGYDDIIVGAPHINNPEHNEGRAYVFHGSVRGISSVPAWTSEGQIIEGYYAGSVAGAGDVNGDGYDDVAIGQQGRVRVYHGSRQGLGLSPAWSVRTPEDAFNGSLVAAAGDVNRDGYADLAVYEPFGGRVRIYHGSAQGLSRSPARTLRMNAADSVCAAGDVNGDGYGDLVVGDTVSEMFAGSISVFLGSTAGLSASASWTGRFSGDFAFFGTAVAAGDIDHDGHIDLLAVAAQAQNENYDSPYTIRGYAYRGSACGFSDKPTRVFAVKEGGLKFDRSMKPLGTTLATVIALAGDVDGDGRREVVMGAPSMDHGQVDEGQALLGFPAGWERPLGLTAQPARFAVEAGGGMRTFTVTNTGCGAAVFAAATSTPWLSIVAVTPAGDAVTVGFEANPGASARTGTVTVTAAGVAGSPLRVKFVQAGVDSFEADNRMSSARIIRNGLGQGRSIHVAGDSDWVRFNIGRASARNVVAETSGTTGDTQMWLFDATGRRLAYDDNSGEGRCSRILMRALATGTYYLRIREYGNDGIVPAYRLRVDWSAATIPPDALEGDDIRSRARSLLNGERQARTIHAAGNRDWARFTLAERGARDVRVETAGSSGDTQLWLYDAAGAVEAYDDDSGTGAFSKIRCVVLGPGTYFIRVQECGNDGTIPAYTLKASWTPQ